MQSPLSHSNSPSEQPVARNGEYNEKKVWIYECSNISSFEMKVRLEFKLTPSGRVSQIEYSKHSEQSYSSFKMFYNPQTYLSPNYVKRATVKDTEPISFLIPRLKRQHKSKFFSTAVI